MLSAGTATWTKYWVELVQACSQDAVTAGRLMIDILNEPDVSKLSWSAQNGLPGKHLWGTDADTWLTRTADEMLSAAEINLGEVLCSGGADACL